MGQYAKAEPLYQRSLKIRESKLGPDHPDVAQSLNNLATLYQDMGQYAKAEPLYQRSLKICESKLGPDHPDVATSLNNLATLYQDMGQYAKAEPLYQRSLKIRESKLGPDHPDVAIEPEQPGASARCNRTLVRGRRRDRARAADHPPPRGPHPARPSEKEQLTFLQTQDEEASCTSPCRWG